MDLKIKQAKDTGNVEKERVILEVKADTDIGKYIFVKTEELTETTMASDLLHPFWLPDKQVKKGDLVVIYTKKGTAREKVSASAKTSHFLYLGQSTPLWTNKKDIALLLHLDEMEHHMPIKHSEKALQDPPDEE